MNESLKAKLIKEYEAGKIQDNLFDSTNLKSPTVVAAISNEQVFGYEQVGGSKKFFVSDLVASEEGITFTVDKTVYNLNTFVDDKTHWGLRFKSLWGDPSKKDVN